MLMEGTGGKAAGVVTQLVMALSGTQLMVIVVCKSSKLVHSIYLKMKDLTFLFNYINILPG